MPPAMPTSTARKRKKTKPIAGNVVQSWGNGKAMIACAVCALPLKCVISATHIRFIRTTFANTAIITGQAIRPENVLNAVLIMFIRTAIAFTANPTLALSVRNAVSAGQHFDRQMESALPVSATSAVQSWRHGMTETVFVILVHWEDVVNVAPIIP